MPLKSIFVLAICGVFVGASAKWVLEKTATKNRFPTSSTAGKTGRWMGKHQRLLDIKIEAVSGVPNDDGKDLVLKGTIQGLDPINTEVFYTWILPPQVSLVSGELEDSVSQMPDPNKVLEREISVQGVSRLGPPKMVVLQAYAIVDGVRIGNSAVFSTQPPVTENLDSSEKVHTNGVRELPRSIQQ